MKPISFVSLALSLICTRAVFAGPTSTPTSQRASAFFPPRLIERVRANVRQSDWGRGLREQAIAQAEPWKKMTDEQLWKLMFGATIPRSWHVFSNGPCPSCKKPVPMYDWQIDALQRPSKVRCPHCHELFPKNDYAKFYESGLDAHGIFDPAKADRKLLFNEEHADPGDPLRTFGVDDGNGYVDGAKRWRFISTYLVFGQWKQAVHLGIKRLATAYVLTGDAVYARTAAILLDRVADLYPSFDFKSQGLLYESVRSDGYVSVWHDATIETREMALAYDAIKPGILNDAELTEFLAAKSEKYQTPIRKHSGADIALNIEQRILRDALANPQKIHSNYPQQYLTMATIQTALDWPANREKVFALLDPVIEQATAVDGTTGEKGLANYSCYAAQRLAEFLGYYTRMDETFLPEMVRRHPRLPQMWRFFIDTWCANQKYYPLTGDTMHIAAPVDDYAGVAFLKDHGLGATGHMSGVLAPSMYSFLWQLYGVTHDPAFVQVLYKGNDSRIDGLPYDLFTADAPSFQGNVKTIIENQGATIDLPSVNKQQWHLAILRSGKGAASRAAWLDYDAGGNHGHADGLNLGLFAKGLDLMPDLGYPPVQFGGWGSARALWYTSTAAHNTVMVDGAQQASAGGKTTLWAAGDGFCAIAASAPELNASVTKKFERTVALIDVSSDDSYVLDVFRVVGGHDHQKFFMSHFGTIETSPDLSMQPASDFAHAQMRNFKVARNPKPGWSVNWKIEDRYKLLPPGTDVRLRYTDFTSDAGTDAYTCEAWAVAGEYNSLQEAWLPRVMVRHRDATSPLTTTFVSLIEPYDGKTGPLIKQARRLPVQHTGGDASDSSVAMRIDLADGRSDLLVSNDVSETTTEPHDNIVTDARLLFVRRDHTGHPIMISICDGKMFQAGSLKVQLTAVGGLVQLRLDDDSATLIRGKADQIQSITADGKPIRIISPRSAQ